MISWRTLSAKQAELEPLKTDPHPAEKNFLAFPFSLQKPVNNFSLIVFMMSYILLNTYFCQNKDNGQASPSVQIQSLQKMY